MPRRPPPGGGGKYRSLKTGRYVSSYYGKRNPKRSIKEEVGVVTMRDRHWDDTWEKVHSQDRDDDGTPGGRIQWKGTHVCIDVWCECGHSEHYDGMFFYRWRCPECGQRYVVGERIRLLPISAEEERVLDSS